MKKTLLAWLSALLLTCLSTHASARPPSFVQPNGALSHWPVFGAVATTFTSYGGSQGNTWEVGGPTGPLWNNNAGAFEAKTPGGAFTIVRGATPVAANDLVTKAYADAITSTVPGTTLVFLPGGTASPGVFTSWPALMTAADAIVGPITIVFDGDFTSGNVTIPSGSYAFNTQDVLFQGALTNTFTVGVTVAFANGCQFTTNIQNFLRANFVSNSSSPVFSAGFGGAAYTRAKFSTTSAPLWIASGTGQLAMYGSAGFTGSLPVFTPTGAGPTILLADQSSIATGTISTSGSGTIGVIIASPSATVGTFGAGIVTSLGSLSSQVSYNDTLVSPPLTGSSQVQGAIDYLKTHSSSVTSTAPGTVLVYQQGGTASPGVFTSWPALMTAAAAVPGVLTVSFDGSHNSGVETIPAGTYAFTQAYVKFSGNDDAVTIPTVVTVANGATISGVFEYNGVDFVSASSAPVTTFSSAARVFVYRSIISAGSGAPYFQVNSGGAFVLPAYAGTILGDGTNAVVSVAGTGTAVMFLGGGNSTVAAGALGGTFTGSNKVVSIADGTSLCKQQDGAVKVQYIAWSPDVLTYQPGGTIAKSTQFTNWNELGSAAASLTKSLTIMFDTSANGGVATIPAGTWAFSVPLLTLYGDRDKGNLGAVTAANGAIITNTGGGINMTSLTLTSASNSPVFSNQCFSRIELAVLNTTGTAPMMQFTTGNPCNSLGLYRNSGFLTGTQPIASVSGTATMFVNMYDGSDVFAGTIANTGSGGVGTQNFSDGVTITSPGVSNTIQTKAALLGYDDTLVSPTLGATQVQGAIDALKLKTLPATGSSGNVLTVVSGAWASAAPSGGSGITQSTGDVVMGPGSGSQVATVEAISGSSPFHITPPILEWNAGVSAPSLTQVVAASGAGQTMALQAQGGATGANGGQLNLLSGAAGSGGQNGEVLMGTPDGLNLVTASPASVDLLSSHNYRIGNWASTFGSGVGEVLVKDDASQPGALVSGGFSFGSHSGNFTINSPSAAFRPYITSPTILQEQAAAATSGQTLTVEAQPGGSGNTNGGALNLQSGPGQGTGVAGAVALSTGDGLNQIALYPGASGAFSRFSFSGGIQQPLFTQETAPSGLNGLTLTIRPQTGGAGSTDGGNLLLTPGIMGSAGTGTNGQLIFQSIDQSNTLEMGDDLFALNPTSPTPITAGNASSQSSVGLNYMPAITYSAGQRFTQIVAEEKFVDVCHIVAPSSSTGNCETGIPMQVSGQMHVHLVTQCRVTTAGSGTTVNDNVTSDGFGDWVNTTGGSGAPTPNGTAVYGQVSSGTPGVFNPIVYTFTGATTGGHGFAGAPYVVSTASGRNLGTLDCTTWADDKFN